MTPRAGRTFAPDEVKALLLEGQLLHVADAGLDTLVESPAPRGVLQLSEQRLEEIDRDDAPL